MSVSDQKKEFSRKQKLVHNTLCCDRTTQVLHKVGTHDIFASTWSSVDSSRVWDHVSGPGRWSTLVCHPWWTERGRANAHAQVNTNRCLCTHTHTHTHQSIELSCMTTSRLKTCMPQIHASSHDIFQVASVFCITVYVQTPHSECGTPTTIVVSPLNC